MNLVTSLRVSNRVLVYSLISTLVICFGTIGTLIGAWFAPEMSLVGLLAGSVLGVFVALHESTIIGCVIGMMFGLLLALFVFLMTDFETAYLTVFLFSLLGAFLGEPFASFWRESDALLIEEDERESGS